MTFEDLKRCLILLSYDTVRPEDESQTWHNVLPYTFEDNGNILMPALKSLKSLKRSNRRMARKSFFHNMFGF